MVIKCAMRFPCIVVSDAPYKFNNNTDNDCASYNNIACNSLDTYVHIWNNTYIKDGILKVLHCFIFD